MVSLTNNNYSQFAIAVLTGLLIARQVAAEQWTVASPNGSLSVFSVLNVQNGQILSNCRGRRTHELDALLGFRSNSGVLTIAPNGGDHAR
jgi:hypothetical protein